LPYEEVAQRILVETALSVSDLEDILDYLCTTGNRREIFFLWRPFLQDPDDDMILELAVAAQCQFIVTFNIGDFKGCEAFGIRAITPSAFLKEIGELL
jgi:predicted nucleic acid-binding protein